MQLKTSQIFSIFAYRKMTFKDFDTRRDQALLATSENTNGEGLEGLYAFFEMRESVWLQTVLAMYDQEIDRDRAMPSCQRLKTMVRRHIDQMSRTRNFRARNERIETGVSVKSHKGRKVSVDRKVQECDQSKANGQCTEPIVGREHNRPLLLQKRRHRLTLVLERQLPESDSHLVVYQLVVPQLVVLRFPRRRTHVVRFSGGSSKVPSPEFCLTQHLATPRRLPCALVHLSTSIGIRAWRSRRMFALVTLQPRHLVQSNLFFQSTCCCATPWSYLPH